MQRVGITGLGFNIGFIERRSTLNQTGWKKKVHKIYCIKKLSIPRALMQCVTA